MVWWPGVLTARVTLHAASSMTVLGVAAVYVQYICSVGAACMVLQLDDTMLCRSSVPTCMHFCGDVLHESLQERYRYWVLGSTVGGGAALL